MTTTPYGSRCCHCLQDGMLVRRRAHGVETVYCAFCRTDFGTVAHTVDDSGSVTITDPEFYAETFDDPGRDNHEAWTNGERNQ